MVKKESRLERILNAIERVGNKMPDPITMFLGLATILVLLSWLLNILGVEALNPATGEMLQVKNLFSAWGIQYLWTNLITNFTAFAPLGMVLVCVMGSSVAERSGLLVTVTHRFLGKSKGWIVTAMLIFLGINASLAGDTGYIVLPPLAAILYIAIGRSPMLGVFVGFAGATAGASASIGLGLVDAVTYGLTETAAHMVDPTYSANVAINLYFLIVSTFVLTITGTLVVECLLIPRFPVTKDQLSEYDIDENALEISPIKKKGLKMAGIAELVFIVVMVLMSLPIFGDTAILADPTEGSILSSTAPFIKGVVFTASLAMLIPGIAYGVGTGRYKNEKDVWADISQGLADMGNYIFMCLAISLFSNFFTVSNVGSIMAIKGAGLLDAMGLHGLPLFIGLIILTGIINLFIGSATGKWALLAPVYIPMMLLLGYDPAITQVAYRIGDSISNPLSPLFPYMPLLVSYLRKYEKDAGMGTVISNMMPFSVSFAIIWVIQLAVWVIFDLPLGPGGFIYRPF